MFLNENERLQPIIDTPFATTEEGFTYLGIKISPDVKQTVSLNYDPLVARVREMLNRWTRMPISMIGRINIIKMMILPKFLYLFQSLPLPLPDTFFHNINNMLKQFIWNDKKARLQLRLLYLPYERGGLRLPNLKCYYWAAQLRAAMYYFSAPSLPAWVTIEETSTLGLPPKLYLYSASVKKLVKQTKNPFLRNTISVWYSVHKHIGDTPTLSQFTPIWGNNCFTPGRADGGFRMWFNRGIEKILDLFVEGNLMSYNQLCEKYDIPRKHFFKYLQLKHFILSTHKQLLSLPPLTKIEEATLSHMDGKGQFSLFYELILTHSKESSFRKMEAWIIDIKEDIQEADWERACFKAQTQSVNTKFKLLQYKWLMRTYLTPCRLNHIYPNVPDICVKCREAKGTLIHCLWECSKIHQFWKSVLHCIGLVVGKEVPLRAKICLLGIYPENFVVSQQQSLLIDFGLLQARRLIALLWRNMDTTSIGMWTKELMNCLALERLTYIVKKKERNFTHLW